MNDKFKFSKERRKEIEISRFKSLQKKNKIIFFTLFFSFFVLLMFIWKDFIEDYGFLYIFIISGFASVFFAWFSSLIILWLKKIYT